jgi:predicted GIY-YIG superfamily endonuclease
MKCDIGYIYCLMYNNKPFYIGQTTRPKTRYNEHRYNCFIRKKDKYVYQYMRSITSNEKYFNDISLRILKIVKKSELSYYEMKYIKYCIDKKCSIYNNCVKTISYKNK